MRSLVTTLRTLLAQADDHFDSGRTSRARATYEELLERAQERADRATEVVARSMLARVHLKRRDLDAARGELEQARTLIDPAHLASRARYRSVRARLAVAEGPPGDARDALEDYLRWAEEAEAHAQVVDACLLLAEHDQGAAREWLQRGIDHALDHEVHERLGVAYNQLGAVFDQKERFEDSLEAYQQALRWHQRTGSPRQVVAAAWAVGATACHLEDWPLARTRLDEAVEGAEEADEGCRDLLALALADLARVHEAAGDIIEARRLVIRAARLAREQDLPRFWPERWQGIVAQGKALELDL